MGAEMIYRLDAAVMVRVLGPLFVATGVAWVAVTLTGFASWIVLVMATVTLVLVVASVVAVVRPPRVMTLSDTGFHVFLVRGAGATAGTWMEVDSVETTAARGVPSIVMLLSGGRSTVIPLSLLGRRAIEAQREIHDRLNAAHGYRHLDSP